MPDIRGLGYLDVQTADLDRWRTFALEGIGWASGHGPAGDGALNLRMDERQARLVVRAGEQDRVRAVGWEVRDRFALDRVRDAVAGSGVTVRDLSAEEADARGVEAAIAFADPAGNPIEVFWGPVLDHSPVITPFGSRFVTGTQGMGHVVLPTTDFTATEEFYTRVLGFLPRGSIRMGGGAGGRRYVRFLGVNERHHSLAIVPAPHGEAPGLVHLMVEVGTLDAVGQALDRLGKLGFSISSTLGRHTNDKMVSFYVRAPGGWDIELGWDGMRVDEAYYTAEQITADSYWGHDWSGTEPLAAFLPPR
ncbi:MAG: 2,3-dihydroxybiphenyl 1,2-dioxygenase [Jatrophihabitans sp.]|nr:MAG: 2,3-dihydroxybiphenyl 1,2-dioxygenase [Jatrophihabitans sp.]